MEEAKDCENSHAQVRRARAKKYTLGAYPFTIDVTFSDGNTKVYVLEDMVHTLYEANNVQHIVPARLHRNNRVRHLARCAYHQKSLAGEP